MVNISNNMKSFILAAGASTAVTCAAIGLTIGFKLAVDNIIPAIDTAPLLEEIEYVFDAIVPMISAATFFDEIARAAVSYTAVAGIVGAWIGVGLSITAVEKAIEKRYETRTSAAFGTFTGLMACFAFVVNVLETDKSDIQPKINEPQRIDLPNERKIDPPVASSRYVPN